MPESWTPTFGLKRAGVSVRRRQSNAIPTLETPSHDCSLLDSKSVSPGRRYLQQQPPKRSPKRPPPFLPGSTLALSDCLRPSQYERVHLAYSASMVLAPSTLRPSTSAVHLTPSSSSSALRPQPQRILSRKTLEPPDLHPTPSAVPIEAKRHLAFGGGYLVDNQVLPSTSPTKQRPPSTVHMYFISPIQDEL
ncbi:hypothetical protein SPRG_04268 [Saprolegnia parasitica CBS 223.65]|uniref:Uncharacterized protein n=1 Tax=Saprolegnia parasitica (strain CBS 223.65) TaxID=695850 RepID=A0A067CK68_SAPPC|nr:hypothetical protein SPRG_04268 [Saprolegnia parasitica CBS 223.65]KDO31129.1 hypothetical protein SPRG_04268 [Saprolegnia parasitica CBS 223.65]|eukprot:XP_012198258.1 hypothetical protein SPRG_04268 [Saprolegnia parasitica CBS 223.65]